MPLVPMRLLLDHAAENDYGLAAFNVNNMEQIQAIMEAAKETELAGHRAGLARCARVLPGQLPAPSDDRGGGALSADSHRHAPGSREQPQDVHQRHRERLYQRDDGRFAQGRRQDAVRLRIQRARDARSVWRSRIAAV